MKKLIHLKMLHSNILHDDFQSILDKLDSVYNKIEEINSLKTFYSFIEKEFEELTEKGKGNPATVVNCLFLLIIYFLGLFTALVIIICCMLIPNPWCKICVAAWHDKLIEECL